MFSHSNNVKALVGSENRSKRNAVKQGLEKSLLKEVIVRSKKAPSGVSSQPMGIEETRQGAINRMRQCFPLTPSLLTHFAIGVENGLVSGAELASIFPGSFSTEHWYDIGICALTVFKNGSQFTYVTYATPLQIPNDCMLPPATPAENLLNLEKYSSIIMPLINQGIDLYPHFSQGKLTREASLSEACLAASDRLKNISVYDFDHALPKSRTVLIFGTFDLFHDLHKRLIDCAFQVGEQVVIYVYDKDEKKKHTQKIPLHDKVQERIQHVSEYAIRKNAKVIVKRMRDKHIPQLKKAIATYSKKGSVSIFGGEDQFDFAEVVNACYETGTPIVSLNRGETKLKLCSSDIREKLSYQRTADIYALDIEKISPSFWKTRIRNQTEAKSYFKKLQYLGLENAEVWKYTPQDTFDKRIIQASPNHGKIIICLPGRTPCSIDRARIISRTIIEDFVPPDLHNETSSYLTCYEQNDANTENYLSQLEEAPDTYFSDDAMECMRLVIMPRISTHIHIEKIENRWHVHKINLFEKKPWTQILKALSEVTFSTRSRGSVLALEIENAFRHCMRALGYAENEIREAGKQIAVISICNLASLDKDRLFTTLSFSGVNDRKAIKYIKSFYNHINQYEEDSSYTLVYLNSTHSSVLAKIPEKIIELGNNRVLEDKDCHYTPLYFSFRSEGNNTLPLLIRHGYKLMLTRDVDFNLAELTDNFDSNQTTRSRYTKC